MKLINHVLKIRSLVQQSIDNRFSKMGLKADGKTAVECLPDIQVEKRQKLEDILINHLDELNDYEKARQETINECTFTLFNRIAAIKVMEDKELFPEVIRRRPENGNKSFAHNLWLEEHPEEKNAERQGLKHFLQDRFNELGEKFPLYNENYPYAILPTADELFSIIEAFNEVEKDPDCGSDIWKGDDILGWLYENFNVTEKEALKASDEKTEYDKVSLQSQVYTPQWVVKFLVDNTLGKLYLEMFPDSELVKPGENGEIKYKIANAPTTRTREPKKMEQLRIIDPACGSGNFLIYTFTLLYDMYINQIEQYGADYSKRDIPKLIIENNIYGVDLDERAVQLSQIALYIKAREAGGRRAQMPKFTNVVASHFFLPDYSEVASAFNQDGEWDSKQQEIICKIWTDLQNAYKFGSLVRVEEVLNSLSTNNEADSLFAQQEADDLFSFKRRVTDILRDQVNKYCSENSSEYALTKANDAMTFLSILSMPFDIIVANPPYTDSSAFGEELRQFVDANYKNKYRFNMNLYACFIKRAYELASSDGLVGMIHPMTFMYIKSYEDVRSFLLNNTFIELFVEYGLSNLFGSIMVDPAFYVINKKVNSTSQSLFISLDQYTRTPEEKNKKKYCLEALENIIRHRQDKHVYSINQNKLKLIKSYPFIYWISDDFRAKFGRDNFGKYIKAKKGLGTENLRFFRFWWEVNRNTISVNYKEDHLKWVQYLKGGPYNKWYGNLWLVLNWDNEGYEIKHHPSLNMRNPDTYFKKGIACSLLSTKGCSFRIQPSNCIYDSTTRSIFLERDDFSEYYFLGLLNSKIVSYILDCLNSTVATNSDDIHRIPFVKLDKGEVELIEKLSKQNVAIKKKICSFSLIERNFESSPIEPNIDIAESIHKYFVYENALLTQIMLNESVIEHILFRGYNLSEKDESMILSKTGKILGDLPLPSSTKNCFLTFLQNNGEFALLPEVASYITNMDECDENADIFDFDELYQNNNGWEDFCKKHEMNPILIWDLFRIKKINPEQRSQVLAFELLADVVRGVFAKDEDGIIPIIDKMGEERLAMRVEQELVGRGYTPYVISQLSNFLGLPFDRFLSERFFKQLSDHLNLFMYLPKTPFIWHLSSGPAHALELFVSIYKWDRNKLYRIKSVYAANREASLKDRLSSLAVDDTLAQMEANTIKEQLKELKEFVAKIDDLLSSGYNPKLDDGVGKNIAPLQKRGMLSYDVLNPGQLKKYLNADW